jgi:tetrapyrrole methylase family protein/MazG family protein
MEELRRAWETIVKLRSEDGCPWDREQTSESMKFSLIEESYEVLESIESGDDERLKEELGDVLLLLFMHARIAEEEKRFSLEDVAKSLREKMTSRHPHVFGGKKFEDRKELLGFWESTKDSLFSGLSLKLPSLYLAQKVSERARRAGFDWPNVKDVTEKIDEEVLELKEALEAGDRENLEEELGDLLFAIASLSRHLNLEAEDALRSATRKFIRRFQRMEEIAEKQGRSVREMNMDELEEIWDDIK